MPNGKVHRQVGIVAGAGVALVNTREADSAADRLLELLGGALGGILGAKIPDIIDPADTPNHRDIGHGLLTALKLGTVCWQELPKWQNKCRLSAEAYRAKAAATQDGVAAFFYELVAALLIALAGALAGVYGGCASHLAMDFCTPKGLPLLARGL